MGVITCNYEHKTSVPVSKMFKALVLDSHNLFPKLMPEVIKSIELQEGGGGAGSVFQTNFVDGFPFKYLKHKFDVIDASNYCLKYTTFEGDVIADKFEKVVYEVKYEVAGEGCVIKVQAHYHTKGDIKEEEVKAENAKAMEIYKIVEQYLLANPTYA